MPSGGGRGRGCEPERLGMKTHIGPPGIDHPDQAGVFARRIESDVLKRFGDATARRAVLTYSLRGRQREVIREQLLFAFRGSVNHFTDAVFPEYGVEFRTVNLAVDNVGRQGCDIVRL